MPRRPVALVAGLTLGDYALWNWSLDAGHEALALVSGLTLPPLAILLMGLLAVGVLRALTGIGRRSVGPGSRRLARQAVRRAVVEIEHVPSARGPSTGVPAGAASLSVGAAAAVDEPPPPAPARKLAA